MSRRALAISLSALVAAAIVVVVVVRALADDTSSGSGSGSGRHESALGAALAHASPATAPFEGLTEVRAEIGDRCVRLVVADSTPERVAGLRGHTADLGPYDGMLFVFPSPTDVAFTMSRVADPLEIAFFEDDGSRNSTRTMPPCPDRVENECPVYRSNGSSTFAVETKPGELPSGPITSCGSA